MTRVRINALLMILLCGVTFPGGAWAHHSIQAQFDINKTLTISGTVARVEYINPHSYLTLNVKSADGKIEKWAFEMTGAGALRRAGLSRADQGGLKNGDEVTVTALASRDESNSGLAQRIETADGRVFQLAPEPGQK